MKTRRKRTKKLLWLVILVGGLLLAREFIAVIWIKPTYPDATAVSATTPSTLSWIRVPVSIHIKEVEKIVDALAPRRFEDTYHIRARVRPHVVWRGIRSHIEFDEVEVAHVDYQVSRGAIELGASGDRVSIRSPVTAHAREIPGGAQGNAGGTASGSSTLTVGSDFNLNPSIDLGVTLNTASILGIDVRGFAQSKANDAIHRIKGDLTKKVADAVNLRGIAEKAWGDLRRCVLLPRTKNVWLRIEPNAVMLDGPHAANGVVTGTLAVQTKIETFVQSEQPTTPKPIPLPDLATVPIDPQFHVLIPVQAQISELNRALSWSITQDDQGTIKLGENQAIKLKNVSLIGIGNRLYLKVAFEGTRGFWTKKVKGTVVCSAVPLLDRAHQTLTFRNVDFTTETERVLSRSAAWLLQPVVTHELQKRLFLNLAPHFNKAAAKADRLAGQIALPVPLKLDLKVESVKAQTLAVHGDQIFLEFDASGTSRLIYGRTL